MQTHPHKLRAIFIILAGLAIIASGYYIWRLKSENTGLKNQLEAVTVQLQSVSDSLSQVQNQNSGLSSALVQAEGKAANYSSVLDQTAIKVENLERLANTDPQLLYKYSKVFFLNENFAPSELTTIDTKYTYNKERNYQIHDRAWPFLRNLMEAAAADGVDLKVISAYRSFGTQAALKSSYKVTYGAGTANAFSADQGYSEHQLGTTVDFTTTKVGASFSGFDRTDSYKWLQENAHKYGFILSYPKNNAYYIFEPWHWRFVGLDLAKTLHDSDKSFYDMDQRELNTYLMYFWNGTTTKQQ